MMKRYRVAHGHVFWVLGLALAEAAHAQQPSASPEARREAEPAAQQIAEALFAEGSTLYQQWQFVHAEQKYREALTHWAHPVIYLYLSRTLEKQGHLESAYETLQQALRRDPDLLTPEDHQVADELRTSLESRLAQIEVHCAEVGAEVLLDGVLWFTAPGRQRKRIRPGQHVVIARKAGYALVTEVATLLPGKQTRVQVHMRVDETRIERPRHFPRPVLMSAGEARVEPRWQPWKPWTVLSAGVFSSAIGGLLWGLGMRDYAAFEKSLTACKRGTCRRISTERYESAVWKDAVGTGMMIVGVAATAVGAAGVLLNRPHSSSSEPTAGASVDLAPLLFGDGAGISARISF